MKSDPLVPSLPSMFVTPEALELKAARKMEKSFPSVVTSVQNREKGGKNSANEDDPRDLGQRSCFPEWDQ